MGYAHNMPPRDNPKDEANAVLLRRYLQAVPTVSGIAQVPKGNYNGDRKNPIQRFVKKYDVDELSGCWIWRKSSRLDPNGYSKFKTMGKEISGHRWSYTYYKGVIPAGLQIDHLCMVTACVNPEHLEAVTQQENIRRYRASL